jgi:hypothetical protein
VTKKSCQKQPTGDQNSSPPFFSQQKRSADQIDDEAS